MSTGYGTRVSDQAREAVSGWRELAACADPAVDPDWFHSEDPRRALAVCDRCPVRQPCLAFAMDRGRDIHGVWGGTTTGQRGQMLRDGWGK